MHIEKLVYQTITNKQEKVYIVRDEDQYGLIVVTNPGNEVTDVQTLEDLPAPGGTFITLPQWDEIKPNICFDPEDEPTEGIPNSKKLTCDYYVRKDGLWGILDNSGRMIQAPIYEEINIVNQDEYMEPFLDDQEHSFMAMYIEYISGRVLVRRGSKWGMLRGRADAVLPVVYDTIEIVPYYLPISDVFIVSQDGRYGVADSHGKFYIQPEYPPLRIHHLEYMWSSSVFRIDGKDGMGYVRLGDGKCLVEPKWDDIDIDRLYLSPDGEPYGHIFTVWKDGHCGLIYDDNGMIIPPVWDEIVVRRISSQDPLSYSVRRGNQWGCCDSDGRLICDAVWDKVNILLNGSICVEKDGKWGAIGTDGRLRVAVEWDEIEGFGLVAAKNRALANTNMGVLLGLGQTADKEDWNNLSWARRNGLWGIIDADGNIVVEPTLKERDGTLGRANIR